MAKVLAPLFSTKARGQIGKSLVFFPWKSINAVRSYVIPANPNTAGQQAQRAKMTNAVDEWHAAGYTEDDKTAWNKFASTLAGALSGFNAMVRSYIDGLVAELPWLRIAAVTTSGPTVGTIDVEAVVDGVADFTCFYGTSPTFMPESEDAISTEVAVTFTLSGLKDGVIYYYMIKPKLTTNAGRTGVYKYKHVAP